MSEEVKRMFAEIAPRYDLANSVLSFGIHRRWRERAVRLSSVERGMKVLDCATGTGDLAMAFKRAVGREGTVIGTDFCADMMTTAPAKAAKEGLEIRYETADAMDLPYEDNSFDAASISFGIRNVDDPVRGLREMARVVRPGCCVVVIEFGQPKGVFGALFRFYSNVVIPFVGGLISGRHAAYSYLVETSGKFPSGENFLALMRQSGGYAEVRAFPQTFGVAYIYIGVVK